MTTGQMSIGKEYNMINDWYYICDNWEQRPLLVQGILLYLLPDPPILTVKDQGQPNSFESEAKLLK